VDSVPAAALRRLLIVIVIIGIAGLLVELLLLEHWESVLQWTPLALLAAGLVVALAAALRPSRKVLRAFQIFSLLCLAAGALGLVLHYRGNVEFELERDPSLGGLSLVWRSLTGATPALAPGAMAQIGLLGLLYAYRHPALSPREGRH
jgi:hypothetical protein